jgi:phosphosulfolactate synthase (CoM biosynthesis protein A)
MRHEEVMEIGAEWLCKQALEQLDMQGLLTGTCRFSETSAAMAMMHITSRAVYPASEHKTAQWIKDNSAVANLFNIPVDKVNRLYAV